MNQEKMTGARIVIETLIEQGVTDVFGYPGGQVLNIYDELYKASYDLTEDLRDGELSGFEQDYEKVCEKYKIVYDNVTKIDS